MKLEKGEKKIMATWSLSKCALRLMAAMAIVISFLCLSQSKVYAAYSFNGDTVTFSGSGTLTKTEVNDAFDEATVDIVNVIIEGYDTIGYEAFYHQDEKAIKTVVANSVTSIDESAFYHNKTMESFTANALLTVGESSFDSNEKLKTFTADSLKTIGYRGFNYCSLLETFTAPELETIGERGFFCCSGLSSINLSKVTSIGASAFWMCEKLTEVELPCVTTIGESAFSGAEGVTSVSFGKATCSIGNDAFRDVGRNTPAELILPENWTGSKPDASGNWYGGKFKLVPPTTITSVSINKDSIELTVGENETLIPTVVATPDDEKNKKVTWKSNNESVATVDSDGKITANAVGSATITATSTKDSTKTATCTVTVSAVQYTITVQNDGNGSASSSLATATAGTEITLTATPNSEYEFDKWNVIAGGVTVDSDNKFTMPAGNVTVKAVFKQIKYAVTVTNDGNGTASASPTGDQPAGTEITLTPTPNAGYEFDKWDVVAGGVTVDADKFTMPSEAVTIKACFKKATPKPTPKPASGSPSSSEPERVFVDLDTNKSEVDYGTVFMHNKDNVKMIFDMKVHSVDAKTRANQEFLVAAYAKNQGKRARIILTTGVYPRNKLTAKDLGTKKFLSYINLEKKVQPVYAVCYNQTDKAYYVSGTINANGTAVFNDFIARDATNITIFTLE